MELDLIMGLTKPKTTPSEGVSLDITVLPVGGPSDFSALLKAENPEDTPPSDAPLLPDDLAPFSTAVPQAKLPEIEPEIGEEADAKPALEKDPDGAEVAQEPRLSVLPLSIQPSGLAPTHIVETTAIQPIATTAITKLEQTAKPTARMPVIPARADLPTASTQLQKRAIIAEATKVSPQVPPDSKAATADVRRLPLERQTSAPPPPASDDAQAKLGNQPVLAPGKAVPQPQAQPATPIGFTNIETIQDDPAEVQFGIRIERQSVVITHVSRPFPHAPPVAGQISAQLPPQITKAEKQTIELRLDPPELGRVTIHLTTHDQHVTAQVVADRADTVDLMRRHADLLTATLARAGFSQSDLSFQQGQGQNTSHEFEQFQSVAGPTESDGLATPAPTLSGQNGRLDIRL